MSRRPVSELEAIVSVLDDLIDATDRLVAFLGTGDLLGGIRDMRSLRDLYLSRLHDARRAESHA